MKALLYKDFCVLWKQMKYMLLLVALFCLIPNQALNLSLFFVIYAGVMIPMSLMAYDERAKWDDFAAMLPYSTRSVVFSRYVFGWGTALFGAVMNVIGLFLFSPGHLPARQDLAILLYVLAVILVAQALFFPYLFRVGVEKGRIYMMFFCILILVLGAGLTALLTEALSLSPASLTPAAPVAFLLALVLCLASVPVAQRQLLRRAG